MINKDLQNYIETKVFPEYSKNEQGHGIKHIEYVVRRSLNFAKEVENLNLDMVYVIASYHDIGHHINAKQHEKVSADIFTKDENMKNFFTEDEIKIISEAIQDHRASGEREPRTIYGKIVSSADRRTDIEDILIATYNYSSKHNKELTLEENIEEAYKHVCNKFSIGGYATKKIYFKDEEFDSLINKVQWLKNNKQEFVKYYCKINGINL